MADTARNDDGVTRFEVRITATGRVDPGTAEPTKESK